MNVGERHPMQNILRVTIMSSAFGALAVSVSVSAAETREHGTHVHGAARLDIAFVDGELALDLYSPAMNIVGFEHEPGNDAQREQLEDALSTLRDAGRVFNVTDAARCRAVLSEASRVAEDGHDGHDGHEEHGGHDGHAGSESAHSEIQARYRYECSDPAELKRIQVRLFELFPITESIRVQMLTDAAQRAMVLLPDNADVPF